MSQSVLKTDISTNNYEHDTFITLNLLPFFFQRRAQQGKVIFEFAWCTCNKIGARDNCSTTTPGAGQGGIWFIPVKFGQSPMSGFRGEDV